MNETPTQIYDDIGVRNDKAEPMEREIKIIIEKHSDGYVAYPFGICGVVVGEGNTEASVLADVKSAIQFHTETFGAAILCGQPQAINEDTK